MRKIGITGFTGLLGRHLRSYLYSLKDIEIFLAGRDTFADPAKLRDFVKACDCIVHFAGMNRGDDALVYKTNIDLTEALIQSCEKTEKKPHIVFSSSTHIYRNTVYGNSKIECSNRLQEWSRKNTSAFTNLILPNVFGEGGKPFHNSVVSTFCYQIAREEQPKIITYSNVEFIHAGIAACRIYEIIKNGVIGEVVFQGTPLKVSELLAKIENFRDTYKDHSFPDLDCAFDRQIFNTYLSYLFPDRYPVTLELKTDNRGYGFEAVKSFGKGQCFVSTTKPGIVRGDHFHLNKCERFLVVQGKARIRIRRLFSETVETFDVDGGRPQYVDMPTLHTHNIQNVGKGELITFFWSTDIFDPRVPDTYPEKVEVER